VLHVQMDGKSTICRNVNVSENELLRMDVLQILLSMALVHVVELLVIICIICLYL
jgi:hypothetical protein